jgi:hypothetical protein
MTFEAEVGRAFGAGGGAAFRATLEGGDNKALGAFGLDSGGRVKGAVALFFQRLGGMLTFQALQVHEARRRYWLLADGQARQLWADPTPREFALMFDVAVQNGGLKELEISDFLAASDEHDVVGEMAWRVVKALHVRLTKKRRPAGIINDCLGRKRAIVAGHGMVHGREWWVDSFGV